MGLQQTLYKRGGGTRIACDRSEDLFLPPSMNQRDCNGSTDTTILVNSAHYKDLRLISPPRRHRDHRIPLVESTDSTEVDSRDRYLVPAARDTDDDKDQAEHTPPTIWTSTPKNTMYVRELPFTSTPKTMDKRQHAEISAIDSLELISLPPSVRKTKMSGLFKKLKMGVTRVSSRLDIVSPRIDYTDSTPRNPESNGVEVRLLAWTDYKITVQIIDEQTKTKIQFKRDGKEIEVTLPKRVLLDTEQVDNDQMEGSRAHVLGDLFCNDQQHQVDKTNDMDANVTKENQQVKQENDVESLTTVGPDDIPHEVSYRTMPSIHSIVFNGIPPAASIPDVSDVSSNSSDASDWTESDDEFFSSSGEAEPVVPGGGGGGKLKKWNKKLFSGLRRRSSE